MESEASPECETSGGVDSPFDDVYRAEFAAVVRVAALIVRSQAVAEEQAQDAFLRLFERFGEVENPAGFLRTTVVRLCLTWQRQSKDERGATLTALYKGMSRRAAIDALESLEWRSDDPVDGFASPSDSWLRLIAEMRSDQTVQREANLLYSDSVPQSPTGTDGRDGLMIHTSSSSAASFGYLATWYKRGLDAGGRQQPLSTYDERWHELNVFWPDGRSITITPQAVEPADPPNRAMLERIAKSQTTATKTELADLEDEVEARIAALPVLGSAETGIGRVGLHGRDRFTSLCRDGSSDQGPSCATDPILTGTSVDDRASTSAEWTINNTWYVAIATKGYQPQIVGRANNKSFTDRELAAETTTIGEWTLHLVQPAPDIQSVCAEVEGGTTCRHHRSD